MGVTPLDHLGTVSANSTLAQVIVADKGFISAISAFILENIRPHLSLHASVPQEVGVPVGQKASTSTEVPLGQTVPTPVVPLGQTGINEHNRKQPLPADHVVYQSPCWFLDIKFKEYSRSIQALKTEFSRSIQSKFTLSYTNCTVLEIKKNSRLSVCLKPGNQTPDFGCPDENLVVLQSCP